LAFAVEDIDEDVRHLTVNEVEVEAVRIDPYTDRKFTFIADPDGLPIELYEVQD
jgi:glyoxylase I family protein